jgi:hypothetical protein
MAKVKQHAFASDDPLLRFWLIEALESSAQVLLTVTAALATEVEIQEGVTLDYWGNRHHLAHPPGALSTREVERRFLQEPLTPERAEQACRIIDTVFDNMTEQFALSLEVASKQVCVRDSRSMPPPRSSVLVSRESSLPAAKVV